MTCRFIFPLALILSGPASSIQALAEPTDQARLIEAAKAYRDRDWTRAVEQLEPILARPNTTETTRLAREYAAGALHRRGEDAFRAGKIASSVADFDREVELHPASDPGHWQRGIAYYYAGLYDKGAKQFERHQTVNPEDVENAVWHFLCVARSPDGTIEKARERLIPIKDDTRVPMKQVHDLFAGTGTQDDVFLAAQGKGSSALFYAYLYVGLYQEALGKTSDSLESISRAVDEAQNRDGYMADVARVHRQLRDPKSNSP